MSSLATRVAVLTSSSEVVARTKMTHGEFFGHAPDFTSKTKSGGTRLKYWSKEPKTAHKIAEAVKSKLKEHGLSGEVKVQPSSSAYYRGGAGKDVVVHIHDRDAYEAKKRLPANLATIRKAVKTENIKTQPGLHEHLTKAGFKRVVSQHYKGTHHIYKHSKQGWILHVPLKNHATH